MPFFSLNKIPSNPPANGLTLPLPLSPRHQPFPAKLRSISHSHQQNQQPLLVCIWSVHTPQSGPSPSPFPRNRHTVTATANATCGLFLFGGYVRGSAGNDLYSLSTRDFSTTLLQTSGEVPQPRAAHGASLIGTTTLLVCGGKTSYGDQNVLNHDSLYLLNLGTSYLLMSSTTPADHSFALQYRACGPALLSMVPDQAVGTTIP